VSAVTWLDRADSIPLASEDVRDGIKVGPYIPFINSAKRLDVLSLAVL